LIWYEVGRYCCTLLTCPIHQGLNPQGGVDRVVSNSGVTQMGIDVFTVES
jgi:hypothetical protein